MRLKAARSLLIALSTAGPVLPSAIGASPVAAVLSCCAAASSSPRLGRETAGTQSGCGDVGLLGGGVGEHRSPAQVDGLDGLGIAELGFAKDLEVRERRAEIRDFPPQRVGHAQVVDLARRGRERSRAGERRREQQQDHSCTVGKVAYSGLQSRVGSGHGRGCARALPVGAAVHCVHLAAFTARAGVAGCEHVMALRPLFIGRSAARLSGTIGTQTGPKVLSASQRPRRAPERPRRYCWAAMSGSIVDRCAFTTAV